MHNFDTTRGLHACLRHLLPQALHASIISLNRVRAVRQDQQTTAMRAAGCWIPAADVGAVHRRYMYICRTMTALFRRGDTASHSEMQQYQKAASYMHNLNLLAELRTSAE